MIKPSLRLLREDMVARLRKGGPWKAYERTTVIFQEDGTGKQVKAERYKYLGTANLETAEIEEPDEKV
jgi:hypothetical protein